MRLGARHSSPRANAFMQYIIVSSPQKLLKVSLISLFPKSPYSQSSVSPINSSSTGYYGTLHFSSYTLPPFWCCVQPPNWFNLTFSTSEPLTMLLNSGSSVGHSKTNNWESVSVERKDASIGKASSLGGSWTHVPRPTLSILLSHDSF